MVSLLTQMWIAGIEAVWVQMNGEQIVLNGWTGSNQRPEGGEGLTTLEHPTPPRLR